MNRKNGIIRASIIGVAIGLSLTGCVTPEKTSYTREEMANVMWYESYTCKCSGITLNCRYFVPQPYDTKKPLVVFLHGAGQKGTDNVTQLYEGDVGKIAYYADTVSKATMFVPQCPPDKEWTDEDMIESLDECVTHMASKIGNVDLSRVYLVGFSMGGIGTYKLAMFNPERYRVLMPVCGGPRAWWPKERPEIPDAMKNVSIWAFNNSNDDIVDNLYSKYIISQMWESENADAHYTEGRNGHCDEYVFSDKANLEWLFSNTKGGNEP